MPYELALPLLAFALVAVAMRSGAVGLRQRPEEPRSLTAVRSIRLSFVGLLGIGAGVAVWEWYSGHDWTHFTWIVQAVLVIGFLGSGCWLLETAALAADSPANELPVRLVSRPWVFPLFLLAIGVGVPTLLTLEQRPDQMIRAEIPHWPALQQLGLYGFGGRLPDSLIPVTLDEKTRHFGHLPRPLTISTGLLLTIGLLALAYTTMRLWTSRLRDPRKRASLQLLGPWMLWLVFVLLSTIPGAPVDPGLLMPGGIDKSGAWESDPATLRAFGPIMALGLVGLLIGALPKRRRRAST